MVCDECRLLEIDYELPYRNLALEEALLKSCNLESFAPTLRIWFNNSSVILGRFQNVAIEVNREVCAGEDVKIVRRFTGGGTVYHDKGNMNVTILSERPGVGFEATLTRNMSILRSTLSKLGIESIVEPPNTLLVKGDKISGSAAAMNRDFILWHASLMISTDQTMLRQVLSSHETFASTSHIRSVRRPTTNLEQQLKRIVPIHEVKSKLLESIQEELGATFAPNCLSPSEELALQELHEHKYSKNSWNLEGHDPVSRLTQTTIAV